MIYTKGQILDRGGGSYLKVLDIFPGEQGFQNIQFEEGGPSYQSPFIGIKTLAPNGIFIDGFGRPAGTNPNTVPWQSGSLSGYKQALYDWQIAESFNRQGQKEYYIQGTGESFPTKEAAQTRLNQINPYNKSPEQGGLVSGTGQIKEPVSVQPQAVQPNSLSESGQYYKSGNDVYRASDNAHVTLDNPDPSLNFHSLGLNFALLPQGTLPSLASTLQPQSQPQPQPQNNPQVLDTGNAELNALLQQTQTYLDELIKRGQTINPNVDITPEMTAKFLNQAQREISPYYSSQMKVAREQLLRQAGYTTDEIMANEAEIEKKYGTSLRTLGETAAETGFAQSGRRLEGEQNLASETQNMVDANRRRLEFEAGNQARQLASEWGKDVLPETTLGSTPRVLAGQSSFQRTGTSKPFYSISDSVLEGLTGSKRFDEEAQTRARANELEGLYRTTEANKIRSLNL